MNDSPVSAALRERLFRFNRISIWPRAAQHHRKCGFWHRAYTGFYCSAERPPLTPQLLTSLGVLSATALDRHCAEESNAAFLIDGMLRARSVNIIAGDSGIGKSPLMCQLGLSVASGLPFFGMAAEQGRVLYLDLENPLQDHKLMRDSIAQHLNLTPIPEEFLTVVDVSEDLEKQIASIKPALVMIDSLRAFKPEVTEKNAHAAEWLKEIRHWARTYDCSFLIAHHLRKENRNAPSRPLKDYPVNTWLEEMEGPRAFTNQTDTRIAVEASDNGLEIKWNRRLNGDSPLLSAERVFN